jgi:hypothetical protein
MAIVATFKPDHEGGYLGGVPACSLDEEDWKALTDEQQDAVKASPLYTMRGDKAADKPKAEAGK